MPFKKGCVAWNKGKSTPESTRNKLSASLKGKRAWNKGLKIKVYYPNCGFQLNHKINLKHGFAYRNRRNRFWTIWVGIKKRCLSKNNRNFKNYGARDITICERWRKFENFKSDMFKSYLRHCEIFGEKNTSIDRINNDGNYELSNCRWATMKEQANNRR